MKKKYGIAFAIATLFAAGNALAVGTWSGQTRVLTGFGVSVFDNNVSYGFLAADLAGMGGRPTTGSCSGSNSGQAFFELSSDKGRALFSAVQSAYLAGKQVRVQWDGTCGANQGGVFAKVIGVAITN